MKILDFMKYRRADEELNEISIDVGCAGGSG
jgi:hypothetical protein